MHPTTTCTGPDCSASWHPLYMGPDAQQSRPLAWQHTPTRASDCAARLPPRRGAWRALQIPGNSGGGERDRTDDPLLAKQVLSQLSYTPGEKGIAALVGLVGFEPTTPALSRRCSNQLSYRPLPTKSKALAAFVRKAPCVYVRVCVCVLSDTADRCGRNGVWCAKAVLRARCVECSVVLSERR